MRELIIYRSDKGAVCVISENEDFANVKACSEIFLNIEENSKPHPAQFAGSKVKGVKSVTFLISDK